MKKILPFLVIAMFLAAGCSQPTVDNQNDEIVGFMKQSLFERYGFDKSMIEVDVTSREGDYAKGKIEMGLDADLPNNFLVYKDGAEWKLAKEWSDEFICPIIEGRDFPQSMISGCKKPDDEFTVADAREIQSVFADMYHKNIEDILISVDQYDAEHARGTVQFAGEDAGGMFLAAKDQGSWDVIIDGNGNFKCEFLEPYGFSDEMSKGCEK
ncbi:hypothetical protein KKG46_01155 [Patescibacteria group bacterium]|nr:hypothetical protein [Patescibacteria group bacterium]